MVAPEFVVNEDEVQVAVNAGKAPWRPFNGEYAGYILPNSQVMDREGHVHVVARHRGGMCSRVITIRGKELMTGDIEFVSP